MCLFVCNVGILACMLGDMIIGEYLKYVSSPLALEWSGPDFPVQQTVKYLLIITIYKDHMPTQTNFANLY